MDMLSIKNVSLCYQTPEGETDALKNVSLDVKQGEFVSEKALTAKRAATWDICCNATSFSRGAPYATT